jgi:putative endonuclease
MYKVYILRSQLDSRKSYVGLTTKEVQERLKEHNDGDTQSTKAFRPWEIIYFELFYCKLCAEKRETFLKSGFGFRLRKLIIQNF